MVDRNQAQMIAQGHLHANPISHPHYRWKVGNPTEREHGWVFEYEIECTGDLPPEKWEAFGGSPAFLVSKHDGSVVDLDWREFQTLLSSTARS